MSFWASLSSQEKQACVNNNPKPDKVLNAGPLNRVEVWRPQGRLNNEWILKLLPKITQVANESYFTDQLFPKDDRHASPSLPVWSLFVVRKKKDELVPTIFALHRDTTVAKKARKIFEHFQRGTLGPLLQGYSFGHAEYEVKLRADTDSLDENSMESSKESLTGAHVLIASGNAAASSSQRIWTHSTMGGSLLINGRYYGLMTAHPFSKAFEVEKIVENDAVATDQLPGEPDTEEDSSKTELEEKKTSRLPNFQVYAHEHDEIGDTSSETGIIPVQQPDPSELINSQPSSSDASTKSNGVVDPRVIFNRSHDWALVPIINPRFSTTNVISFGNGQRLPITGVANTVPSGQVLVGSGVSAREWTEFPHFASAIALPDTNTLQIVWSVQQQTQPGDSGSWVFDREGRAFAMVVAGSDDGETYCLPLATVFENIQQQFGGGNVPHIVAEPSTEAAVMGKEPGSPTDADIQHPSEDEMEGHSPHRSLTRELSYAGDASTRPGSDDEFTSPQPLYRRPTVNEDTEDTTNAGAEQLNDPSTEGTDIRDYGETESRSDEDTETTVRPVSRRSRKGRDKVPPISGQGTYEESHNRAKVDEEPVLVEYSEKFKLRKSTVDTKVLRDRGFLFHKEDDHIVVTGKSLGSQDTALLAAIQVGNLPPKDPDEHHESEGGTKDLPRTLTVRTDDQPPSPPPEPGSNPDSVLEEITREEIPNNEENANQIFVNPSDRADRQGTEIGRSEGVPETVTYRYLEVMPPQERERSRGRLINPSETTRDLIIREKSKDGSGVPAREEIIIRRRSRSRSGRKSRERSLEKEYNNWRALNMAANLSSGSGAVSRSPPRHLQDYAPGPPRSRSTRVHCKEIGPASLDAYGVPWARDPFDQDYILVNDYLTKDRWQELRMHTAKLQSKAPGWRGAQPARRYNSSRPFNLDDIFDTPIEPSRSALVHRPADQRRKRPKSVTIDERRDYHDRSRSRYEDRLQSDSNGTRIRIECRNLDSRFEQLLWHTLLESGLSHITSDIMNKTMIEHDDKERKILQHWDTARAIISGNETTSTSGNVLTPNTRESSHKSDKTPGYPVIVNIGSGAGDRESPDTELYGAMVPVAVNRDERSMATVGSRGTVFTID